MHPLSAFIAPSFSPFLFLRWCDFRAYRARKTYLSALFHLGSFSKTGLESVIRRHEVGVYYTFFVLSLMTYDLRRKAQKVKNLLADPSQRCVALKINVVVTNYSFILLKSFKVLS